ncbi:MAG: GDP-mannose 4,6-dehydratase [Phycisphaerales bacterium]|nr:GDP-mannose 4,6-dehydratase [Phycisphaerales bacterium]
MKKAVIAGISGQDGSYLAELLLEKGYEVHGIIRRSTNRRTNIDHLRERLHLHYGDLGDVNSLSRIIDGVGPDELYNLAAQSHVRLSFDNPIYTTDIVALGAARLLEIVRRSHPKCRFYQASTGEIFGHSPPPQSETSPLKPQSPYGVAKLYAHHSVRIYREGYGMFACAGILFNHESPRRGDEFVTRKITRGIAAIVKGKTDTLMLGNLVAQRDWGYAKEFVEAMWLMLQQDKPDDYVVATGKTHSVHDFVELAFSKAGLDFKKHVRHDPTLERPNEVPVLCGDPTKARRVLGWTHKTSFEQLVQIMLDHDLHHDD